MSKKLSIIGENTESPQPHVPYSDEESMDKFTKILSALSKEDALKIFMLAKNGLQSELETPSKIGLTRKQYYTRLKQLVEMGLLAKNPSGYGHTLLGSTIYQNHVIEFIKSVKNSKNLEMLDVLKKTSKFSEEEIQEFMSKLGLKSSLEKPKNHAIHITWTFEEMINNVIEIINSAQKEIILVTRFANDKIINSMLKRADGGVSAKVLADINMVGRYFEEENTKVLANDKNKSERFELVSNPFYPSKQVERRYAKVPFSMLIIDSKKIGLEIVDANNPNMFRMALFGENENLAEQLKALFNSSWKKASQNLPEKLVKSEIKST